MKAEESASMDSILASIRKIIASEPDPMPEEMQDDAPLTTAQKNTPLSLQKDSGSILELRDIVERRQKNEAENEVQKSRVVEPAYKKPDLEKSASATIMSHISQKEKLGEGFEAFLKLTLEKIVVDFLKDWSDQNIPRLAESVLREEIKNTFERTSAQKSHLSEG